MHPIINGLHRRLVLLAALLLLEASVGCDRSGNAPQAPNSPTTAADAEPSDGVGRPSIPTGDARPRSTAETRPTADRASDAATPSNRADWSLPTPDLSKLPEPTRNELLRAQERVRQAPGSAQRIVEVGMRYCVNGFHQEAEECFREAANRIPNAMKFRYLLALNYEEINLPAKAITAYEEAIDRNENYPPAYVNLANLIFESDPQRAITLYTKAISLDPRDTLALYGLARAAHLADRREEAIDFCKKALDVNPNDAQVHALMAEVYEKQGKSDQAAAHRADQAKAGKPIIANDPIRSELLQRALREEDLAAEAIAMARRGDLDRAAKYLEEAIDSDLAGESVRRGLGAIYLMQNRPEQALAQFVQAQRLYPDSLDVKSDLALANAELGRIDEANQLFKEVLEARPNDGLTMRRQAAILAKTGKQPEALNLLRSAATLQPNDPEAHFDLGSQLAGAGRIDEAIGELTQAARLNPNHFEAMNRLAALLAGQGKTEAAVEQWKNAITANPQNVDGYLALAQSLLDQRQPIAAVNFLLAGLQNSPDSSLLANAVAWVLATCPDPSVRNPEAALTWAQKACDQSPGNFEFIDTFAAALASSGKFHEAAQVANEAVRRARDTGRDDLVKVYAARRDLYANRKPFVDNP